MNKKMPEFSADVFSNLISNANQSYSKHKNSSMQELDAYLTNNGASNAENIQTLWAKIQFNKQQKYKAAGDYLKSCIPGGLVDAIPINPTMEFTDYKVSSCDAFGIANLPIRYFHVHRLRWCSSNGNLASLKNILTREYVAHRSAPNGPPFNRLCDSIPVAFNCGGGQANTGQNVDEHSVANPRLILRSDFDVGSVVADQNYQYSEDNGKTWLTIPGAVYEIEKGVRVSKSGGQKVFFFRKQDPKGRFHFEVEYQIGELIVAGANTKKVPLGLGVQKDIKKYPGVRVCANQRS